MRFSERLITSDPLRKDQWIRTVSARETAPELYVLVLSSRPSYTAEIFSTKEFYKAIAQTEADGPVIIGIADSYGAAVTLFQKAVEKALVRDPDLSSLKLDLKELYA